MNKLSIIIVSFNTKILTLDCLKSIYGQAPNFKFEIIVVDNNSSDDTVNEIRQKFKSVKLIENNQNIGFSSANNQGIQLIKSQYYLLLNSDTVVNNQSLDNLLDFATQNNFGIVSPEIINPDGTFQPSGGNLPDIWPIFLWLTNLDILIPKSSYQVKDRSFFKNNQIGWVGGTAMLINNQVVERVGLLDEKIFMYAEDVEYCLRAKRLGFKIGWCSNSQVIHLGGGSSDNPKFKQWLGEFKGLIYIYQKHYGSLAGFALRIVSLFFILIRALVFFMIGKIDYGRTYAQVAINL